MAFKLIEAAQPLRVVTHPTSSPSSAPALPSKNGKLVERPDESWGDAHAA